MVRIVVGGQINKQEICAFTKEFCGSAATVDVKNDLDAAMAMQMGQYDYYIGACNTGGGGGASGGSGGYTLPLAADGVRGGVQVGYTTSAANRNYAVQLDNEKAYVNVPWTDHHDWSDITDKPFLNRSGSIKSIPNNADFNDYKTHGGMKL